MESPYFSIIIPALNEEKYISGLLKSLINQTYKEFEVILVDGMSADKTVSVFKKFQNKLPRSQYLVADKKNVSYQRNLGGKKATGKYLIFFDADVKVNPTFLEEVHLASLKQKFSLATTWIEPDSEKTADRIMLLLANIGQEVYKIVNRPFSGGYNTIVTKKVFLRLNGFREMNINEDHDFAIRAFKKKIETIILPEPKVIFSLRRFRSEGTLNVLRKYAHAAIYAMLKGPVIYEMFEYRMGGHVHKRRRKKINFVKINTYIKTIEKLENNLNKLLRV
ncbi:hypothetical protein A3D05_02055 [Candidatus Gottesmanbacteria bacterium RIFCSPHIGHO2_02_FULL_40_24]|uniref:Glycosyltransferase 2-like domain-containing protein n=1 Tax=Candidatus Gottesmanbacteria bacterium RIFCSPHIGHO2_01_FULL_40_15 TaxID=1798376 RepID=A0A1F5Z3M5_9BACT|nr:MAG: hypothetical protein A2777_04195 [Candidatus Gottesmanbacteria bacterium RIFCSPHIGHO2_01_FULL_40_15]OGG18637.1 MAG: hypothetical protein A3D05_02055 [Candidatus Gottesmanbacteria bacterium RIFCSPHIGHO2_02_FULL_40_24]OGG22817.1 MAG: hypothetical protein A3B48_05510 [Candidatus Gottesmanbacteria bacterium RIFCSPLOWO2_01_FULL_40_10]OGG24948.1 MAG: hypothetical protein A3E42_02860 [Candidatus Gottesmanbacteria bacterium RIFCSPHIGHO2_12_FULL_40_13]OGG31709.1 MAG: hypothetical protein A3I80_0